MRARGRVEYGNTAGRELRTSAGHEMKKSNRLELLQHDEQEKAS